MAAIITLISSKKKRKLLIILTLTLLLGLGALAWFYELKNQPDPIPSRIKESVTYPLYYPAELPDQYSIDKQSFQTTNQVVIYYLVKDGSPSLSISIQPRPNNFNFEDFHLKKMTGSKEVLTQSGKAVIGTYNDRIIGSLVTDKSWLLVAAPSKVSAKGIETIVKSLVATSQ
jgi:hypothetical protein